MEQYEYLAHHGIKGQKWGVRRYQNPDGTLTDAGRKKYTKKASKLERKAKIQEGKAAYYDDVRRSVKYVGGVSWGTLVGLTMSMGGLPVAAVGVGTSLGYMGGKALSDASYKAAMRHANKLANKKYSKAAEYRKLLENG